MYRICFCNEENEETGNDVTLPSLEDCEKELQKRGYEFSRAGVDLSTDDEAEVQVWTKKTKKRELMAHIREIVS